MGPVPALFTFVAALIVAMMMPASTRALAIRIALLWAGAAAAIFLIPTRGVALTVIAGLLLAVAPWDAKDRTRFFLATFYAIPQDYTTIIPFPGLNHLVFIEMSLLSAMIVLIPVAAQLAGKPSPRGQRTLDFLVIAYVLVNGVLALRDVSFTSAIRQGVVLFFTIWLPYYCITRTHRTQEDFERTLTVFLQGLATLAAIGVISSLKQWNYYGAHFGALSAKFFFDIRNGLLRILGTLYWPIYGLLMAFGAMATLHLSSRRIVSPTLLAWALAAVFAFCCFATGTRGAWMGAAAAICAHFFFVRASSGMRVLAVTAGVAAGFVGAYLLVTGGLEIKDATGNFEYRAKLMQVGVRQVMEAPLLGVPNVTELPEFQQLRQGEGIVDIVNLYLLITLYTGFVGMVAFLAPVFAAFGLGMKALALTDRRRKEPKIRELRSGASLFIALIAGILVMAVTTSAAGYFYTFIFIALAMTAAAAAAVVCHLEAEAGAKVEPPQPPPAGPPNVAQTGPAKKPYGARLVHRV